MPDSLDQSPSKLSSETLTLMSQCSPLERNLCSHPLAGLLWERRLEEVLLHEGGKGNVFLFTDKLNSLHQCMLTTTNGWTHQLSAHVVNFEVKD